MPAFFIYLLKVNIALLLFWAVYRVVLRRLTFYQLNRAYLLFAILCASIFPLINFSQAANMVPQRYHTVFFYAPNWTTVQVQVQQSIQQITIWQVLYWVYWAGVALMTLFFIRSLLLLAKVMLTAEKQAGTPVSFSNRFIAPFSFGNRIFINPACHGIEEMNTIVQHESVHVRQWHTFDLLLAEINKIIYWFNPGAWLLKGAVRENLEFIADRRVLRSGIPAKRYQYELLQTALSSPVANGLANGFAFRQLKKRIIMMNRTRSGRLQLLRYLLLIPLLATVAIVFAGYRHRQQQKKNIDDKIATPVKPTVPDLAMKKKTITYALLVLDAETRQAVEDVRLLDDDGQLLGTTDANGYIKLKFPVSNSKETMPVLVNLQKEGYENLRSGGILHGKAVNVPVLLNYAQMRRNGSASCFVQRSSIGINPQKGAAMDVTVAGLRQTFAGDIAEIPVPEPPVIAQADDKEHPSYQSFYRASILSMNTSAKPGEVFSMPVNGKPLLFFNGKEVSAWPETNEVFLEAKTFYMMPKDAVVKYGNLAKDGAIEVTTVSKPDPRSIIYNNLPDAWYFRWIAPDEKHNYWQTRRVEYEEWEQLPSAEKGIIDVVNSLKGRQTLFTGIPNPLIIRPFGVNMADYDVEIVGKESHVNIIKQGIGLYTVLTSQVGKVKLHITGTTTHGAKIDLGFREFEIKTIAPAEHFDPVKHAHLTKTSLAVSN
jgi:hypothetical protein